MSRKLAVLIAIIAVAVVAGALYYALVILPATRGVKLVVVTRLSREEADAIREAFLKSDIAREYGVVDIEFRKLDMALWKDLAVSGEVDAFFVGEIPVYSYLCEKGALRPMDLSELLSIAGEVSDEFKGFDSEGRLCWIGVGVAVYGYIVHNGFVDRHGIAVPEQWIDVLRPEFGRAVLAGEPPISFPLPSKSGTAKTIIHGVLQKYGWSRGWQVLTVLGALSRFVDSSERARDEATEGIVALAPAYIGYGVYAEKVSGGTAKFIIPRGEGILYISPAAIARETKHPREAQAFILWLLSDEGQRKIAELFYYIPVRRVSGVEFVMKYYEALMENAYEYDRNLAKKVESAVIAYFEAAIADPDVHQVLSAIWMKALDKYFKGELGSEELSKLIEELGSPLSVRDPKTNEVVEFTIEYATEVSKAISEDPAFKDMFANAVKVAALERYNSVLAELEKG